MVAKAVLVASAVAAQLLVAPIAGAVTISAPVPLDTTAATSRGFLDEAAPSVAWGGGNFLVLWRGMGLARARLDPGGNLVDPIGLAVYPRPAIASVGSDPTWAKATSLLYDGSAFVASWETDRGLWAARLGVDGSPIDPAPVAVAEATGLISGHALAFAAGVHLLVWRESVGPLAPLRATLLDADLCETIPGPLDIAPGSTLQPAAASNGSLFLVAWVATDVSPPGLYFTRVDASGAILDVPPVFVAADANSSLTPRIASDGSNWMLLWTQSSAEPLNPYRWFVTRVAPSGAILDPPTLVGGEPSFGDSPDIVFDGGQYVAAWPDRRGGVWSSRISVTGTVLDPAGFELTAGGRVDLVRLAHASGVTLAAFRDDRNTVFFYQRSVYAARTDTAATPLDPVGILVSRQGVSNLAPAIAGDGGGYLAAWSDQRRLRSHDLAAARIDGTGRVIEATPVVVAASDDDEESPGVASLGGNWLLAWERRQSETQASLYAARVSNGGALLDPVSIPVAVRAGVNHYLGGVASDGAIALVAWLDNRAGWGLYVARIDASGNVLDPGGVLVATPSPALPRVVFDGVDFLLAWGDTSIYGARVTIGGVVRDPGGRRLRTPPSPPFVHGLATGGGTTAVLWDEGDVRMARIGAGLSWPDGAGVRVGPRPTGSAAFGYDGAAFPVVTVSTTNGVELVRVLPDLTVLDPQPQALLTTNEADPWIFGPGVMTTANGPAGYLAGFSGWIDGIPPGRDPLVPRAYFLKMNLSPGCAVVAHAVRTSAGVVCANQPLELDATRSALLDCASGAGYQWRVDGSDVVGATLATVALTALTPGPHRIEAAVHCAADVACFAVSPANDVEVLPGPPTVGPSLRLIRRGSLLHAEWADVGGAKSYVVVAGVAGVGPFPDELGAAPSGVPGLDLPMPVEPLRFLHVAVADRVCGTGPP